jgi:hypothetical protein
METRNNLIYRPTTGQYFYNETEVPRVTRILSECGLIKGQEFFTNGAAERGTAVHLACEYFDAGSLDESTLSADIKPYVEAYWKFLKDCEPKWELTEHKIFCQQLWYAGKLDRFGMMFNHKTILDIKTGIPQPANSIQLAFYAYGFDPIEAKNINRFSLYLSKEGSYKLIPSDDKKDFEIVKALSVVYNWRKNNGVI